MKIKLTFIVLCLVTINFTTEKKLIAQKPLSAQQLYVWWKEVLYTFVLVFWLDHQKASNAKIYCDTCNHFMNSLDSYGYLAAEGDSKNIEKLKKLWHTGTIEMIAQFLQTVHNQNQIECVKCLAFKGWHCKLDNIQ